MLASVITRFAIALANIHDPDVSGPDLTAGTRGLLVGDRNYWNPSLKEELLSNDIYLQAPFRNASRDSWPNRSALLSRIRYRIDTVFGQLVDRYQAKRVWANDSWHFHNRHLRKVLSHISPFSSTKAGATHLYKYRDSLHEIFAHRVSY